MEAAQLVLHPHVKGRRDRPPFIAISDVQSAAVTAADQAVNHPRVSMNAKDNVFIIREERVVILVGQPLRVLRARPQLHETDDIDPLRGQHREDQRHGDGAHAWCLRHR